MEIIQMGIIQDIFIQFKIIHANVSNVPTCCVPRVRWHGHATRWTLAWLLTVAWGRRHLHFCNSRWITVFVHFLEPEHKIIYIIISLLLHPLKNTGYFWYTAKYFPGHPAQRWTQCSVQFGEHLDTHHPGIRRQGWAVLDTAVRCSV